MIKSSDTKYVFFNILLRTCHRVWPLLSFKQVNKKLKSWRRFYRPFQHPHSIPPPAPPPPPLQEIHSNTFKERLFYTRNLPSATCFVSFRFYGSYEKTLKPFNYIPHPSMLAFFILLESLTIAFL